MGFFKSLFSVLGDWTQGLVCILQVFDNWDISQFLAVYFLKVCEPDWTLWQDVVVIEYSVLIFGL